MEKWEMLVAIVKLYILRTDCHCNTCHTFTESNLSPTRPINYPDNTLLRLFDVKLNILSPIKALPWSHQQKRDPALTHTILLQDQCVLLTTFRPMEAMLRPILALLILSLPLFDVSVEVSATTMTFYNKCTHPVWPGIQPSAGKPILARGGFKLPPNKYYSLRLPAGWSGRMWGRHGCSFDANGRGHCATGDCGGALFCNGIGGTPPATLAEITLGNDQDFYDVSLVDGYNLAISVTPFRGTGKCNYAGCVSDLNTICPVGLQVRSHDKRRVVACKSACSAFNSPRYCCTGTFGSPQSCKPTAYSKIFKSACPRAYSYAYDDPTSIATCTGGSYLVTFCPHH